MGTDRILVRGPNWTGDLVMATPGFRALREAHPRAHIALQVRAGLEALVAGAAWFDEVLPLSPRRGGALALAAEGAALRRRERFDLGICIPDSFSSALVMRAGGVRRVVGFGRAGRGLLLHQRVVPPAAWGARRIVARERFVLALMSAVGCPERGTHLELFTTPEEESRAEAVLAAEVRSGAPWAALAPGASFGPAKLWPADRFARLGDALAAEGLRVVLLGAPGETALCARVRSSMRGPAVDLSGRLDLGALKAVIRRAAVLVCNDAGARHVAVAFGIPVVMLLGPTDLAKTACNLEGVQVLAHEVPCRPCNRRRCPIDHRCMNGIEPATAVEAALRAVRAQRAAALSGRS